MKIRKCRKCGTTDVGRFRTSTVECMACAKKRQRKAAAERFQKARIAQADARKCPKTPPCDAHNFYGPGCSLPGEQIGNTD